MPGVRSCRTTPALCTFLLRQSSIAATQRGASATGTPAKSCEEYLTPPTLIAMRRTDHLICDCPNAGYST